MRPASIKETKNGYNDENYITPRTLRAALANYSPSGGGSSEGGTTDYNKLENKPSINGVTLSQNKTLKDLGIQPEGAYLTEVPDTYKTKDENDRLYQPKGSYQPAGSYQETLVSGDNIKTVNGQSLLGEGDLTIAGGEGGGALDPLPVGTIVEYDGEEIPDGFELVENVSGDGFFKHDDGITLECWGNLQYVEVGAYSTVIIPVTLPMSYKDNSYVATPSIRDTQAYWADCQIAAIPVSGSEVYIAIYNNAGATAGLSVSYRTIGRCK